MTSADKAGGDQVVTDGYRVSSPVPDHLLIDSKDAAKALQDCFLANADRGDNAANDELVDALVDRIRARRASNDGGR